MPPPIPLATTLPRINNNIIPYPIYCELLCWDKKQFANSWSNDRIFRTWVGLEVRENIVLSFTDILLILLYLLGCDFSWKLHQQSYWKATHLLLQVSSSTYWPLIWYAHAAHVLT